MKHKCKKDLLCAVVLAAVLATVAPIHCGLSAAEETTQPAATADQTQYVIPDNQQVLLAKIDAAKKLGVQVTVREESLEPIVYTETEKVKQAKQEIETHNADAIQKLEEAIEKQKKTNESNLKTLQKAVQPILGTEWTADQFAQFASPQKKQDENLSAEEKLYNLVEKLASMSIVNQDPDLKSSLNLAKSRCQTQDFVTKGDFFLYENMFRDSLSGKTVDLKVTVVNVFDAKNSGSVRSKMREYIGTEFDEKQPHFYVEPAHLQVQVEFLAHGTDQAIEIEPIIAFSDIDAGQGVQINKGSDVLGVLQGSQVKKTNKEHYQNATGVGDSADDHVYYNPGGSLDEEERSGWVLFHLDKTSQFTYTYFNPTSAGHILGGKGLTYHKPTTNENTMVNLVLKKQPLTEPTPPTPSSKVPNNKVPNQYFGRLGGRESHSSFQSKETTVGSPTRKKDVVPHTGAHKNGGAPLR